MTHPVVFLLDVDNTLLDNDQVIADLKEHLTSAFGAKRQERYWALFEAMRSELGYADYLGALQRFRIEQPHEPHFLHITYFLLGYPFEQRLFPGVTDVLKLLSAWGPTVILTDGDVVFQPYKVKRSGLFDAVDGRVLIYIHKEQELADVERRFGAKNYVLIDDKVRLLTEVKKQWGPRVTTVFPRQGHYALDTAEVAKYPPPDVTIDKIGDLLRYDLPALLAAGTVNGQPRE